LLINIAWQQKSAKLFETHTRSYTIGLYTNTFNKEAQLSLTKNDAYQTSRYFCTNSVAYYPWTRSLSASFE